MTLDPRTIAADIMCGNARSITPGEIWAHIGQAYDTTDIDATIADDVAELIAKTGIDLIWPDGTKNTELDAARVEIERLTAELSAVQPITFPDGSQTFMHECHHIEWWNEQEQGPVNDQGCDACESSPFTGGWQPVYIRKAAGR